MSETTINAIYIYLSLGLKVVFIMMSFIMVWLVANELIDDQQDTSYQIDKLEASYENE